MSASSFDRIPALDPRQRTLTLAVAAVLAACAPTARAADGGANGAPDATLDEIVVTANHREQSVLDVPYNISAITGATLETAGVGNLTSIARLLPGVTIPDIGPRGNSSNSLIIIRGMNVNDPITSFELPWGSVPTVSTYVDDVPLYVNLKLDDIARIEVLRGPQGTLYGSGAVGGTLKIVHNAPDPSQFAAEVSTEASRTDHASDPSYGIRGMLNVPLAESLAFRLSAGTNKTAGFIDASNAVVFGPGIQPVLANPADPLHSNYTTEALGAIDDARSFGLRAALRWKASDVLEANLAYQRQDDHSNGFSSQTVGSPYTTQALVPQQPEHRTVDLKALTLTADAGFATVTSSTSYSVMSAENVFDQSQYVTGYSAVSPLFYGNYPRVTSLFYNTSRDTNIVQELRLVSKQSVDWDYTIGGFFQHQGQQLFEYETVPGFAAWSELPGSANAVNQSLGSSYSTFGDFVQYYNHGTRPSALSPTDTNYTYLRGSKFLDRAVYGELTRHVTQDWQITAGARQFWQEFSQSLYSTIPYGGPFFSTLPPPANATDALGSTNVDRNLSFRNHIFKLNTSYTISPQTHVYATFSEGFRHGGINALPIGNCVFCESETIVPYKSDSVKNYEVGLKGEWAHWLRYSAAAYRVNWTDVQIQIFGQAGDPAVVNGNKARSQGLELELNGELGAGFSGTLGYGLTDAKITQDFAISEVVNGATYQLVSGKAGDRLPYVPRQTVTLGLDWLKHVARSDAIDFHIDAAYHSNVTTQLNDTVLGYRVLGGFTTVNAALGYTLGKAWHLRLFGSNLTNVLGVTAAGSLYRGNDDPRYRIEFPTRPRTLGVGFDYKFE